MLGIPLHDSSGSRLAGFQLIGLLLEPAVVPRCRIGNIEAFLVGVWIRGDPWGKVPFKRARSRVKKGPLLRGLPNTT